MENVSKFCEIICVNVRRLLLTKSHHKQVWYTVHAGKEVVPTTETACTKLKYFELACTIFEFKIVVLLTSIVGQREFILKKILFE